MGARGQRLGEAQIRERLDLVDRWRGSGLSMRVWAQGQGLEAGVLIGAVAYESRWRAKLACQAGRAGCEAQGQGSGFCAGHEVGRSGGRWRARYFE